MRRKLLALRRSMLRDRDWIAKYYRAYVVWMLGEDMESQRYSERAREYCEMWGPLP